MPQTGFHGIIGLAAARRLWPGRAALVLGVALGSLLPDADLLGEAIMQLAGINVPIHRTLSHSLFFAAALVAAGALAWAWRQSAGFFLTGLGLGVLGHEALDILFWFTGLGLLWPVWGEVNIWAWYEPTAVWGNPDVIGNELAALDAAAFALYLGYLIRLARRGGAEGRMLEWARVAMAGAWALFPVYVASGIFLSEWWQNVIVFGPIIVFFYPVAAVCTIVFRREIAGSRGEIRE